MTVAELRGYAVRRFGGVTASHVINIPPLRLITCVRRNRDESRAPYEVGTTGRVVVV